MNFANCKWDPHDVNVQVLDLLKVLDDRVPFVVPVIFDQAAFGVVIVVDAPDEEASIVAFQSKAVTVFGKNAPRQRP